MLERWSKLLTRDRGAPQDSIAEEFLPADELWLNDVELKALEDRPVESPAPLSAPRKENLISRYGSEVRSALGPGTLIEGKFAFDTPVRIDGTLRGEVHSSSLLIVGEEGSIEGLVCVGNLMVFGKLKGHIVADEVIQIAASGEVKADIESGQLAIELGGRFQGTVKQRLA